MRGMTVTVVGLFLFGSFACATTGCSSAATETSQSVPRHGLTRRTGVIIPEGGRYDVTADPPADWADNGMLEGEQVYELQSAAATGRITVMDMKGRTIFAVVDVPPGTTVRIDGRRLEVVPPRR